MAKKKATRKKTEEGQKKVPAGTTLYCWKLKHPKVGWVGGHDDDHWEESEAIIRERMSYCEYETELISKVTT